MAHHNVPNMAFVPSTRGLRSYVTLILRQLSNFVNTAQIKSYLVQLLYADSNVMVLVRVACMLSRPRQKDVYSYTSTTLTCKLLLAANPGHL